MLKTVIGRMGGSRGFTGEPQGMGTRKHQSSGMARKDSGGRAEAPWAGEEVGVGRSRIYGSERRSRTFDSAVDWPR